MFRYARQFADADEIVISTRFWYSVFPAKFKIYLEQITGKDACSKVLQNRENKDGSFYESCCRYDFGGRIARKRQYFCYRVIEKTM